LTKPKTPQNRVDEPLEEEELRRIVARLARQGNMPACRLYFEVWIKPVGEGVKPSVDDPLAEVDELARKRVARGA
jgi:hypothetical protein